MPAFQILLRLGMINSMEEFMEEDLVHLRRMTPQLRMQNNSMLGNLGVVKTVSKVIFRMPMVVSVLLTFTANRGTTTSVMLGLLMPTMALIRADELRVPHGDFPLAAQTAQIAISLIGR